MREIQWKKISDYWESVLNLSIWRNGEVEYPESVTGQCSYLFSYHQVQWCLKFIQNLSVSVIYVIWNALCKIKRIQSGTDTLLMDGYFHTIIWFWEYPWVLTSSFTFLLHARLQTCIKMVSENYQNCKFNWHWKTVAIQCITWLPVSTKFSILLFTVFQKRMHRSAVPPPDARRPCWCGDQAMALTAAVCSMSFKTGCWECWFHTNSCRHFDQKPSIHCNKY